MSAALIFSSPILAWISTIEQPANLSRSVGSFEKRMEHEAVWERKGYNRPRYEGNTNTPGSSSRGSSTTPSKGRGRNQQRCYWNPEASLRGLLTAGLAISVQGQGEEEGRIRRQIEPFFFGRLFAFCLDHTFPLPYCV